MAQTYNNPTLPIFSELGDRELTDILNQFQFWQQPNLEALRLISNNSNMCYPNDVLREQFDKKMNNGQDVGIDVVVRQDPTGGTAPVRIGNINNGLGRNSVGLVQSPTIEENFVLSTIQEALSRFSNYSIEDRLRFSMMVNIAQMVYNCMLRAEVEALQFIDTNKWVGGGVGTIYSAVGDAKEIPAGVDPYQWVNIKTEAKENRIDRMGSRVQVLGNVFTQNDVTRAASYAEPNQFNTQQSLNGFDFYYSDSLQVDDPLTEQGVFYTIARGGVGMIAWAFKYGMFGETVERAEDTWVATAPPPMPSLDGLNLDLFELQIKGYDGYQDTSATFPADDNAIIDRIKSVSAVLRMHFFRAFEDGVPTPIIKYIKKK